MYGALSTALVMVLATVALTTSAPPPPAIAEFAPEAVQQIRNAPPEQAQVAADRGRGGGTALGGSPEPTAASSVSPPGSASVAPVLPVTRVARAHTCVGSPPRQTEDLQSPPCVAFYKGKLLGATTRGVTANEIRVVIPCDPPTENGGNCAQDASLDIKAFTAFFNERFELYGRKLKVIRYNIHKPLTVTNMIADAQAIEALKPFAVLDYLGGTADVTGTSAVFFRELARRKILSIQGLQLEAGTTNVTQAELQAQAPYAWTYQPTTDMILTTIGDLVCSNLVGRPPWFDVEQVPAKPEPKVRKFGIAFPRVPSSSANLDIGPLTRRLDTCKAPYVTAAYEPTEHESRGSNAIVSKFHTDGVTTVVPLAAPFPFMSNFQQPASQEAYFPEWITSNIYGSDAQFVALNLFGNPDEKMRTFGLRSDNKPRLQALTYNYQAVKEYDSNYTCCDRRGFYQGFLLLASGIQMAGPDLTPQSFERALFRTSFPGNATAGAAPDWQSRVAFGPGDHTMQGDFGFQSINQNEQNNDQAAFSGAYCNVERGVRFGPGELNRPLRFFKAGAGAGPDPCYG